MSPLSGLRIHYNAPWELLGGGTAAKAGPTRTYRRLWKSQLIHGGNSELSHAEAALSEPTEIEEYIYLLIEADTSQRAATMASVLQAHIENNIENGSRPDDITISVPTQGCSYIIRIQQPRA